MVGGLGGRREGQGEKGGSGGEGRVRGEKGGSGEGEEGGSVAMEAGKVMEVLFL